MNSLRKILTYIFLTILLMQSAGLLLVFLNAQYQHKREVRNYLSQYFSKDNFQLIKIPVAETLSSAGNFQRMEDTEFSYDDKLFDIYHEETIDDTVYFYCLRDDTEEIIVKSIDEFFNNKKINAQTSNFTSLFQRLPIFVSNHSYMNLFGLNVRSRYIHFPHPNNSYLSIILDVVIPPPRSFS